MHRNRHFYFWKAGFCLMTAFVAWAFAVGLVINDHPSGYFNNPDPTVQRLFWIMAYHVALIVMVSIIVASAEMEFFGTYFTNAAVLWVTCTTTLVIGCLIAYLVFNEFAMIFPVMVGFVYGLLIHPRGLLIKYLRELFFN